jgi:hypothetical protein
MAEDMVEILTYSLMNLWQCLIFKQQTLWTKGNFQLTLTNDDNDH